MSGTGESEADFAGEARAFRIRLGEIRRIEARCGVGIGEVLRRLSRCVMLVSRLSHVEALASGIEIAADDVREPIYQGLMGAGMTPGEASKLLRVEIDDRGVRGLLENAPVALGALWASRETPDGDEEPDLAGEPQAGASPAS